MTERNPILSKLTRLMRTIPVAEEKAKDAIQTSADALKDGELVCIFPEGRITDNGEMYPFKQGVARIVERNPVPVIPMAHWGAQEVMGPYRKDFKVFPRKTMHVLIGPPVELDDLRTGGEPDAESLRQATDRVMTAITALLREVRHDQAQLSRGEAA